LLTPSGTFDAVALQLVLPHMNVPLNHLSPWPLELPRCLA